MNKAILQVLIVVGVIVAYLMLAGIQTFFNDVIASGNISANWTGMESSRGAYNSMPLVIWFIPGIVGVAATVINFKFRS